MLVYLTFSNCPGRINKCVIFKHNLIMGDIYNMYFNALYLQLLDELPRICEDKKNFSTLK